MKRIITVSAVLLLVPTLVYSATWRVGYESNKEQVTTSQLKSVVEGLQSWDNGTTQRWNWVRVDNDPLRVRFHIYKEGSDEKTVREEMQTTLSNFNANNGTSFDTGVTHFRPVPLTD